MKRTRGEIENEKGNNKKCMTRSSPGLANFASSSPSPSPTSNKRHGSSRTAMVVPVKQSAVMDRMQDQGSGGNNGEEGSLQPMHNKKLKRNGEFSESPAKLNKKLLAAEANANGEKRSSGDDGNNGSVVVREGGAGGINTENENSKASEAVAVEQQRLARSLADTTTAGAAGEEGNRAGTSMEASAVGRSPLKTRQVHGAYAEREAWLTKQEQEGDIRFECVKYTGECNLTHLEWLLSLKNIFSRQLPNMPKEYIVRLVFDKHHRSMVAVKKGKVFGGCTFRQFENQEFGEIVFLAIAAQEQVRGYGTRLMNHLKEYAKEHEKLTHFLTYADNNAIGYFQKQGFTREIFLEREKWGGYIKDYDGGTLMECALNYQLSYTKFSKIIKLQREFLDAQVRKISKSHLVYPGLQHFKNLKPGEYKKLDVEKIPGLKEVGQSKAGNTPGGDGKKAVLLRPKTPKYQLISPAGLIAPNVSSLHSFMTRIHAAVVDHNDSWPFKEPVDRLEVPDYYQVIKDPVDLSLIARRICSYEYYIKLEIFVADFKTMFTNCRTYNSPDTIYYKCANRLESFFEHQIRSGISFVR